MSKVRLDIHLVENGYFESREKARRAIMAGLVFVNGCCEDKPGCAVNKGDLIELKGNPVPYVSRGGLKLEKAIKEFKINLENKICIDIGASTGGFTDCMLTYGAVKVYSIDVGYGQLAWKLRNDKRVIVMERTNFRYVKPENIGELVDFIAIDVSFISLIKILPPAKTLLKEIGTVVCLIKPQFEAGREKVGKKGVVRDPAVHFEVVEMIAQFALEMGFSVLGLTYSPIKGPEGNIEYLLYIGMHPSGSEEIHVQKIVNEAHRNLV